MVHAEFALCRQWLCGELLVFQRLMGVGNWAVLLRDGWCCSRQWVVIGQWSGG